MAEEGDGYDVSETGNRKLLSTSIHLSSFQSKNVSEEISRWMSNMGYAPENINARRKGYKEWDSLVNAKLPPLSNAILIVGSKGEGLTFFQETDVDVLILIQGVVCLEEGIDHSMFSREKTMLRLNTRTSYPGHCRLIKETSGTNMYTSLYTANAFRKDEYGREELSRKLFIDQIGPRLQTFMNEHKYGTVHDSTGPALPFVTKAGQKLDAVYALPCHYPSVLQRWAERPRHWPPSDIVQKVVSMGAVVTPVGFKGSEYKDVEWRICFNTGERELVSNFNDTQVTLYVLLKMIKTDILNPSKKEITSYTLKNIVLWLAEKNPPSLFHEKSLLHWVREGLHELKNVITTRQLPYYMIPERNLMAACGLKTEQERAWVAIITDLINQGPMIIFILPKIRQAILAHPESLLWYYGRKIELDELAIMDMKNKMQCMDENGKIDEDNIVWQATYARKIEILSEFSYSLLFLCYVKSLAEGRLSKINDHKLVAI